jgi:hypothetical protein
VIPDLDIWRSAMVMVKRYGADAAVEVPPVPKPPGAVSG